MQISPIFWLAAAVGFLALEASTFNMTSIWFAIGSAAALLCCVFTGSFRVQAVVFLVVSILCLAAFRPLAAKLRLKHPAARHAQHWRQRSRVRHDHDDHRHLRRHDSPCRHRAVCRV